MAYHFYDVNDRMWNTWSSLDIKAWLVAHNVVSHDADIQRGTLYDYEHVNAQDTIWDAYSDAQMRARRLAHAMAEVSTKSLVCQARVSTTMPLALRAAWCALTFVCGFALQISRQLALRWYWCCACGEGRAAVHKASCPA